MKDVAWAAPNPLLDPTLDLDDHIEMYGLNAEKLKKRALIYIDIPRHARHPDSNEGLLSMGVAHLLQLDCVGATPDSPGR